MTRANRLHAPPMTLDQQIKLAETTRTVLRGMVARGERKLDPQQLHGLDAGIATLKELKSIRESA